MTEENENNEPNQSHSEAAGQNAADKVAEIEALEGKLKTLRWGLFIGVLAILTIGLNAIYNTSKKAIQPVVEVYDEAKETYEGVETKINDAQTEFVRLQPKVEKAYGILNELIDSDSKPTAKLRTELKTRLENEVEPAAERLADRIFVDIRGDAMKQLADLSENSDDIMRAAHEEYRSITNSLPDRVTEAIEETLVKMIRSREDRMREMFPKLTKEKQAAVASRLSQLSDGEGQDLFAALFADHLVELTELQQAMEKIREKETGEVIGKTNVESTIALLSAVLDIAMSEYDTSLPEKKAPKEEGPAPKETEPEPKPQEPSASEPKPETTPAEGQ